MKASLRTLQSNLHARSHDLDPPVPRRPHRNRVSLIVARVAIPPFHKPESFLLIHHFYNYDNLADVSIGYAHGGTCFGLSSKFIERQFSLFETTAPIPRPLPLIYKFDFVSAGASDNSPPVAWNSGDQLCILPSSERVMAVHENVARPCDPHA